MTLYLDQALRTPDCSPYSGPRSQWLSKNKWHLVFCVVRLGLFLQVLISCNEGRRTGSYRHTLICWKRLNAGNGWSRHQSLLLGAQPLVLAVWFCIGKYATASIKTSFSMLQKDLGFKKTLLQSPAWVFTKTVSQIFYVLEGSSSFSEFSRWHAWCTRFSCVTMIILTSEF